MDGLTIVGYGINPSGNTEAWIATVPEPGTFVLAGVGFVALAALRAPTPAHLSVDTALAASGIDFCSPFQGDRIRGYTPRPRAAATTLPHCARHTASVPCSLAPVGFRIEAPWACSSAEHSVQQHGHAQRGHEHQGHGHGREALG